MAGERLRVTGGKASGTEISLEEGEFLMGRATTGEGRLGEDPELSRNHARIARRAGDQLTIEDLGSTNGTFVNGKQVEEAQPLRPGDTIKVGTTTMQVLDETGAAPQATALGAVPPPRQATTPAATPPAPPAPTPPPPAHRRPRRPRHRQLPPDAHPRRPRGPLGRARAGAVLRSRSSWGSGCWSRPWWAASCCSAAATMRAGPRSSLRPDLHGQQPDHT